MLSGGFKGTKGSASRVFCRDALLLPALELQQQCLCAELGADQCWHSSCGQQQQHLVLPVLLPWPCPAALVALVLLQGLSALGAGHSAGGGSAGAAAGTGHGHCWGSADASAQGLGAPGSLPRLSPEHGQANAQHRKAPSAAPGWPWAGWGQTAWLLLCKGPGADGKEQQSRG